VHSLILMSDESSAREKLSANGVPGRGPRHPAASKVAPLDAKICVGPSGRSVSMVVVEISEVVDIMAEAVVVGTSKDVVIGDFEVMTITTVDAG
jgi:hypothetical protein